MISTSTIIVILNGGIADTGTMIAVVLSSVVAGVIALMGLGFGIAKVRQWITGRPFDDYDG